MGQVKLAHDTDEEEERGLTTLMMDDTPLRTKTMTSGNDGPAGASNHSARNIVIGLLSVGLLVMSASVASMCIKMDALTATAATDKVRLLRSEHSFLNPLGNQETGEAVGERNTRQFSRHLQTSVEDFEKETTESIIGLLKDFCESDDNILVSDVAYMESGSATNWILYFSIGDPPAKDAWRHYYKPTENPLKDLCESDGEFNLHHVDTNRQPGRSGLHLRVDFSIE